MKHPGTKRALLQWPTVPLQMFCLSVVLESPRNTILSQPRLSFLEETEVSYQTSWENTKSRKKWRITAKHGWEETHSAVWLPHTLPHTLSSFLCSSVDSSTPYSHEIPETIKATHKSQETKATTILKHIHVTGHHRAERGLFLLPVPGIEPGASCVLGKHSATEVYP